MSHNSNRQYNYSPANEAKKARKDASSEVAAAIILILMAAAFGAMLALKA